MLLWWDEVGLELRKFISSALHEIILGINDAHEEFYKSPMKVKFMNRADTEFHDVNFNVAIFVEDQALSVMSCSHLSSMPYEQLVLLANRIEFKVPISCSSSNFESKYFIQ